MKNFALSICMLALCGSAYAQTPDSEKEPEDSTAGFVFTDVITIPHTSVKDQNRSGTCWAFSTTSFIEDEVLRKTGREVDLSEMFTVRQCYADKADRFVRMYGDASFGGGGSVMDVPYVITRYGAIPEEAYPGICYGEKGHDHSELDAVLDAYVRAVAKRPGKRISTAWKQGLQGILDAYLGEVPETFTVDGKQYTPQTYAASLGVDMADYVPITSFTHHPFYEWFIIEVPDNWLWERNLNLPMEEMKAVVDYALEHGYPVAWGADVSEDGFKWYKGVAMMPKGKEMSEMEGTELSRWVHMSDKDRKDKQAEINGPDTKEIEVTQQSRQEMYDRQETTDDHGMEIIGVATDQAGNRFYKVKNSWDTNQVYDGFFYVSEPYFLAKTLNILVNREAIPADIAKKAGLKK